MRRGGKGEAIGEEGMIGESERRGDDRRVGTDRTKTVLSEVVGEPQLASFRRIQEDWLLSSVVSLSDSD